MTQTTPAVALGMLMVAVAIAGCGGSHDSTTVERWFDTTRSLVAETKPDSGMIQIDPSADCELVDDSEIDIDGKNPELFGAATARFGEVGDRYQCAWSGDSNASANVRLEVVMIDDSADFANYRRLVPTRGDNTVVATEVGYVQVASFKPDSTRPSVTTSILVVPEQQGAVQLIVELLDPGLDWTPDEHAALLAAIVG